MKPNRVAVLLVLVVTFETILFGSAISQGEPTARSSRQPNSEPTDLVWFLMEPQEHPGGSPLKPETFVSTDLPIGAWNPELEFNSKEDCETKRKAQADEASEQLKATKATGNLVSQMQAGILAARVYARCAPYSAIK